MHNMKLIFPLPFHSIGYLGMFLEILILALHLMLAHLSQRFWLSPILSLVACIVLMMNRGHKSLSLIQCEHQVISSWFPCHSFSYTSSAVALAVQSTLHSGDSWAAWFGCTDWPFRSLNLSKVIISAGVKG